MKIFAIGDLHLDGKAQKPMDLFGMHWTEHEEKIKKAWEETVTEQDVVLIPGDISWAMRLKEAQADLEWLEALPGQKICIRGNHDYWWDRPGKLNKAFKSICFLQNTAYLIGELAICGTRGWLCPEGTDLSEEDLIIYEREILRLELSLKEAMKQGAKEIWVMTHYPVTANKWTSSKLLESLKNYPVTRMIYGHLHDEKSWSEARIGKIDGYEYHLVAADYLNFKPLLITSITDNTEDGERK